MVKKKRGIFQKIVYFLSQFFLIEKNITWKFQHFKNNIIWCQSWEGNKYGRPWVNQYIHSDHGESPDFFWVPSKDDR